jgi:hypothetical protein
VGGVWLDGRTGGYVNLLDVLRAGGVSCSGYAGWEHRSRSSGGFEGLWGIVAHHTASSTTPANDLNYMVNADDGPISTGLLDRTGHFTVIAAGAANHAGKGGGTSDGGGQAWHTTRGVIPGNDANRYALGIEAANAGTGAEPWPQAQQDAYVKMVRALCDGYALDPHRDVRSHAEWTPPRKIDPKGPSRWGGSTAPWAMDLFRNEVASTLPAPIPPGDDEMPRLSNPLVQANGEDGTLAGAVYLTDGNLMAYRWVRNETELDDVRFKLRAAGLPDAIEVVGRLGAFGVLDGPPPA